MRDGPPSSPTGSVVGTDEAEEHHGDSNLATPIRESRASSSSSMTSATNLLKEISTLRLRLHDLEEDNKSSIAGTSTGGGNGLTAATIAAAVAAAAKAEAAASSAVSGSMRSTSPSKAPPPPIAALSPCSPENDDNAALRKELAKLEHEKAEQEAEFMNQMSSLAMENQSIISDLKNKLQKAETQRDEMQLDLDSSDVAQVEGEKWKRRLEEERRCHAEEVERLTANIQQADEEIAESKQEIDYLQQEAVELQSDKEDVLQQATSAKMDLENERRKSETYRVQLKESKEIATKLLENVDETKKDAQLAREEAKQASESLASVQERYKRVEKELEEAQMSTSGEEQSSLKLRAHVSQLDTELQKERSEKEKLQQKIQQLQEQLTSSSSSSVDTQQQTLELEQARVQIATQERLHSELRAQVTTLQTQLEKEQQSSHHNNGQNTTLERTNSQLQARVSELQSSLLQEQKRIASHASKHALELEEARKSIAAQEQRNEELQALVSKLQADLAQEQDRKASRDSQQVLELEEARRKVATLDDSNTQLQDRLSELQADLKQKEQMALQQTKKLEMELDNVRHQLAAQERGNGRLREQIHTLRSELEDQKCVTRLEMEKATEKEITDLQKQLAAQERNNAKLRGQLSDLKTQVQHNDVSSVPDHQTVTSLATSPEEKKALELSVMRLEQRLQHFQSKLVHKDKTIDDLTFSLKTERMATKSLRREVNTTSTAASSVCSAITMDNHEQHAMAAAARELDSLRKRNKTLYDEVVALRRQVQVCETPPNGHHHPHLQRSLSPERSFRADAPHVSVRLPSTSKKAWPPSPPHISNSKKNSTMTGSGIGTSTGNAVDGAATDNSPRTPVSGIVASFERRIHHHDDPRHNNGMDDDVSSVVTMDARRELEHERNVVDNLQRQLTRERKLVSELREQLSEATTASTLAPVSNRSKVERQLMESEKEVNRLQTLVGELECQKQGFSREIERLKTELSYATDMAALQEEKKDEDDNKGEEIERLRTQVSALQPELENAMGQNEHLQSEIDRLNDELQVKQDVLVAAGKRVQELEEEAKTKSNPGQSRRQQEAELNQLKVELTKTQVAKADMENRVQELQTELEALETEAETELDEMHRKVEAMEKQLTQKGEEISRLEQEKVQLCSNMTNVSSNRNDEFEELQSELMDMTTKTNAQAREVQTLKMRLEERNEREQQLQNRIGELEAEISSALEETRGSATHGLQAARSRDEMDRLQSENQQLRESIRTVKMERRTLQERVESMAQDKSSSKSVQVLRDRNNALKHEVEKLTKRLKKMEESITRFTI